MSPPDMMKVLTTTEREIELLIDSFFLSQSPISDINSDQFPIASSQVQHEFSKLLYDSLCNESDVIKRQIKTSQYLGSFLTSRLILRGFDLDFQNFYLYELANAIRSLSFLDTIRLNFILKYFTDHEIQNKAVGEFLRQSNKFIDSLTLLTQDDNIIYERKILYRQNGTGRN
jgi:hypothetical protein